MLILKAKANQATDLKQDKLFCAWCGNKEKFGSLSFRGDEYS
jgi:hypothetical protein